MERLVKCNCGKKPQFHFETTNGITRYWYECKNCGIPSLPDIDRFKAMHLWNMQIQYYEKPRLYNRPVQSVSKTK